VAQLFSLGITTRMTESQTIAWILLCVPDKPGTLQNIIAMADAINHAIPTHRELQTSLGWLQARGLVSKQGRCYSVTEIGSQLLSRLRSPNRPMMKTWDLVSAELQKMIGSPAPLDDVTPEETDSAYQAYKTEAWKIIESWKKGGRDA
jgi:hypothetical protein